MNSNYSRRRFLKHSTLAAGALALASDDLLRAQSAAAPATKRTAVDVVPLGNTGLKISRLGMGTGSANGGVQTALGRDGFTKLVHYAYDQGVRYLDCAQAYATFTWIADAIKGLPREKIFIQSKIDGQPADVLAAIDSHRKNFNTDYVDSMLIHCMYKNGWTDDFKRVMDAFDQAHDKKWISSKGVSCHSLPALRAAVATDWTQVHLVRVNPQGARMDGPEEQMWSPVDPGHDTAPVLAELKTMRAKGRGVIGMKIIGDGTFVNPDDREKSIRFAMSRPELDAIVIGFKSADEIDEAIKRMNLALASPA
ncbi:MAG: aldo/keto reductase [Verrucomicrobiota bacterium]|jgi:aryl-alcohol dehydrogenase-like predicted oxidoreductase